MKYKDKINLHCSYCELVLNAEDYIKENDFNFCSEECRLNILTYYNEIIEDSEIELSKESNEKQLIDDKALFNAKEKEEEDNQYDPMKDF